MPNATALTDLISEVAREIVHQNIVKYIQALGERNEGLNDSIIKTAI